LQAVLLTLFNLSKAYTYMELAGILQIGIIIYHTTNYIKPIAILF